MSIVVRFPPSSVTKQQDDAVRKALDESGEWPPEGCRLHVCFGDEQDIRVSEIWEWQEQLDAFGEKLRPSLEESGIELTGQPEVFEAISSRRSDRRPTQEFATRALTGWPRTGVLVLCPAGRHRPRTTQTRTRAQER